MSVEVRSTSRLKAGLIAISILVIGIAIIVGVKKLRQNSTVAERARAEMSVNQ